MGRIGWCMSGNDHLLNVKVDSDSIEAVKETHPYGTISREVRKTVEALANGEEYKPDKSGKSAEKIYQERIESDTYPSDWDERRENVLLRDDFQCANCKEHGGTDGVADLVVHHIVPLEQNGTNYMSNLVTLCVDCHHKIPK